MDIIKGIEMDNCRMDGRYRVDFKRIEILRGYK